MLKSTAHADRLASEWGIGAEDIVLIALNACGLDADIDVSRLRFRLRLRSRPDVQLYMILSLGRRRSPFRLDGKRILLDGDPIADIDADEADDAVLGYWRNAGRVLTLNSNARSACTGCVFCPNTLEEANDPPLGFDDLATYFATLAAERGEPDLAGVEKITVCTGCFRYEDIALKHLRQVREAMSAHNCGGDLHFLSSVLTSSAGIAEAARLGPFQLTITAEAFTKRNLILKDSKASVLPADMVRALGDGVTAGLRTDFTYIVGLDPLDVMERWLREFVPVCTEFPNFQVFQAHTALMDVYVADGARDIEYYLAARRTIEELFGPTGLRPLPWENYRPLWYLSFADEPLVGERI
ncbi:radical SAM protein [Nocardia sp. NPDC060249]|uniref:radical SAM protein n=1 Tax=Nocardia sp. NPDC060249 TaxID=3347082 RepID=UPI003656A9DB